MKRIGKFLGGFIGAFAFASAIAFGANIPLITGPQDPSQLVATLNQVILAINSGVVDKMYTSGASVGTTAVTTEETLYTYTLPANSLSATGDMLRIRCGATTAATANNKTFKLYFGGSSFSSGAVASNGGAFNFETIVIRTGAATQMVYASGTGGTGGITPILPTYTAGTDDLTATVTIKCTAQNGTAAANDTVGRFMSVEKIQ